MQFVEVTLDPGETVIAEAGAMMFMTRGIEMQTVFGNPSNQVVASGIKLSRLVKRVLTANRCS